MYIVSFYFNNKNDYFIVKWWDIYCKVYVTSYNSSFSIVLCISINKQHSRIIPYAAEMVFARRFGYSIKPQWIFSQHEITLTQHELGNGG